MSISGPGPINIFQEIPRISGDGKVVDMGGKEAAEGLLGPYSGGLPGKVRMLKKCLSTPIFLIFLLAPYHALAWYGAATF